MSESESKTSSKSTSSNEEQKVVSAKADDTSKASSEDKKVDASSKTGSESEKTKVEEKKADTPPKAGLEDQKTDAVSTAGSVEDKKADTSFKASSEDKKADDTSKTSSSPESSENKAVNPSADLSKSAEKKEGDSIQLEGLFAFKMSMSHFYDEKGASIPVTALRYEPCFVSQIKTQEKESYSAIQLAFQAQKNKRCSKALSQHLKASGFKEGARFVKEIRQKIPENIKVGQKLSIESLKKGDLVKLSSLSKGRGFSGVMKRWNFAGGKASHGSKSHRRTGSIGQHTEPARVFPGRKMPGQYGFKRQSRLKVPVVDVLPEEGIIFVKGAVPGSRNTLVSIRKM